MPMIFDDIRVGQVIPPLTKPPVSRLQLALYAGAGADHNPIHVDEEAARRGGLPGSIAHGMLTMACLGELLTRSVPQQNIRRFSARFVAMAFVGDTLTYSGRVTEKDIVEGEPRLTLELAATNQKGDKVLLGEAVVALTR